jgi:hypothetical protein
LFLDIFDILEYTQLLTKSGYSQFCIANNVAGVLLFLLFIKYLTTLKHICYLKTALLSQTIKFLKVGNRFLNFM